MGREHSSLERVSVLRDITQGRVNTELCRSLQSNGKRSVLWENSSLRGARVEWENKLTVTSERRQ